MSYQSPGPTVADIQPRPLRRPRNTPLTRRASAVQPTELEPQDGTIANVARGLGWFSIALGLAEVTMPGTLVRALGCRDSTAAKFALRACGLRELGAGLGVLLSARKRPWLWARTAGDVVDLALLGAAPALGGAKLERVAVAATAVLGITALDILAANRVPQQEEDASPTMRASVTIGATPAEVYAFWRKLSNLPRFMTHLETVREVNRHRSHWRAKGPAGAPLEWDAEIVDDQPNERIDWVAQHSSAIAHRGSVTFLSAPGGGTEIRVHIDAAPTGFTVGRAVRILNMVVSEQMQADLRRFKQVMELGEVVVSDATLDGEDSRPAQPRSSRRQT